MILKEMYSENCPCPITVAFSFFLLCKNVVEICTRSNAESLHRKIGLKLDSQQKLSVNVETFSTCKVGQV